MLIVRSNAEKGPECAEIEDHPADMLRTSSGFRPLSGLRVGHRLKNATGGLSDVVALDQAPVLLSPSHSFQLGIKAVMIKAHAFGPDLPSHPTVVSAYQRVFLNDPEIRALVGGEQHFFPAIHLTIFEYVEVFDRDEIGTLVRISLGARECFQLNNLWLECYEPTADLIPSALEQTHEEIEQYFGAFVKEPSAEERRRAVACYGAAL